jgi:hypothetical protein
MLRVPHESPERGDISGTMPPHPGLRCNIVTRTPGFGPVLSEDRPAGSETPTILPVVPPRELRNMSRIGVPIAPDSRISELSQSGGRHLAEHPTLDKVLRLSLSIIYIACLCMRFGRALRPALFLRDWCTGARIVPEFPARKYPFT